MNEIDVVLKHEGSLYTNDPLDRGGPTKFGITQRTLSWWLDRPATVDDVKNLDEGTARLIYYQLWVKGPKFHLIPDDLVRFQLVDFGVNSGPAIAIKKLQEILGVDPDGVIGPETLRALSLRDGREVSNLLVAKRIEMLGNIVIAKPSQLKWLRGWLKRALSFLK